jgi:hypothetical protein
MLILYFLICRLWILMSYYWEIKHDKCYSPNYIPITRRLGDFLWYPGYVTLSSLCFGKHVSRWFYLCAKYMLDRSKSSFTLYKQMLNCMSVCRPPVMIPWLCYIFQCLFRQTCFTLDFICVQSICWIDPNHLLLYTNKCWTTCQFVGHQLSTWASVRICRSVLLEKNVNPSHP